MDLPSNNMYETFKDEIWQELGPLDPDWFDTLTSQTFANEENVCDQEDLRVNQDEHVKTAFDRNAVDSQLFSTPKVFRHHRVVSPEAEDEQLYSAERDKVASPWTATQSPYLFPMSKEGVPSANYGGIQHQSPANFDLLQTPQKSNRSVSYAMNISESLGAHIHSDISWTSSLNTPPAVPSTLILSKPDESPSPMSVSADSVVFVRKLFPSLSNTSRVVMVSPNSKDMSNIHQGGVSPVAGQNPESHDSSESPLNHSNCSWRQTLPDAIEDGEIRSTIANVLAGAENVLSIFFTNSSSALRKVKADRTKRKQIVPTKEDGCSSVDASTANNAASSGQKTAEHEPGTLLSPPPVKTQETGPTQWSPLGLSQIPPCAMDTSSCDIVPTRHEVENSVSTEQPQSDFDSGQLVRQPMKTPDSVFTKKKRKFVYTVTSKPQAQRDDTQSQKLNCSPGTPYSRPKVDMKPPVKVQDEADGTRNKEMQKRANLAEEDLPHPVQDQDLDISQLSRVFAQDFSQMSKVAEDNSQNGFSPSACLTAMKQPHLKSRQANLHYDYDVSQRKSVSTTIQNTSISERTVSDSGFHSAVTDITHVTASSFVLPSSENNDQSQQWMGFKDESHRTQPFSSPAKGNGHLDNILHEESQTLSLGGESELCVDNTSTPRLAGSAKEAIDNKNCVRPESRVYECLPEKTPASLPSVSASGFKTASNRCIQISSAKLERAKRLFEETERESASRDQPIKCAPGPKDELHVSHGAETTSTSGSYQSHSANQRFVDNSCQLTASQKADVTELCTLLEEADSQFEFTQFKTAKLRHLGRDKAPPPQNSDKELDPDFLTGIDFDDSFNSDTEKHPAETVNVVSDVKTDPKHPPTGLSLGSTMVRGNSSTEDASSCSKHTDKIGGSMSIETKNLNRAECIETSNTEDRNPLLGVGFKTAGGNVLRVSKKCLSKAKALFADLEDGLVTSERSPHKQNGGSDVRKQSKHRVDTNVLHPKEAKGKVISSDNSDTAKFQSGFQMASGKHISFSVKSMEEAEAFFKDCHVMDPVAGTSVKEKLLEEPISHQSAANGSAGIVTEVAEQNVEIHDFGLKNTSGLVSTASFHGNPPSTAKALSSQPSTASQRIGSSAVGESGGGVSAVTMKKAESRPSGTQIFKDTNEQPKPKEDAFRSGHFANPRQISLPKTGGFQTAGGKGVTVSSVALQKAKLLFNECETNEDEIGVKPRSKMSAPAPPPRNRGFLAASGRSVAVSSEALHKAKALFSDISVSADITPASDTKRSGKTQDNVEHVEKTHCGFSTAAGAKVHVSQKNLLKAKNLLKEFDEKSMEDADAFFKNCSAVTNEEDLSAKHKSSIALVSGRGSEKKNLSKCQRGQTNNWEKNGIAVPENEHVSLGKVVNHEKMLDRDDLEIPRGFFQNMPDSTSAASLHGNPPLIVKPLSSALSTTSKNVIKESSFGGGFCTASGKKVLVSDDAVTKAKALLDESAAKEDAGKQTKQKIDNLPVHNGGFQTASGKGVAISSAALKKAKSLLSECEGVKDNIAVKPTHPKMSAPAPSPRNGGFLKASGKPVAFSPQALQKATALFSDIGVSAEIPAAPNTRRSDKNKQDSAEHVEKIQCGFSTAGGAKVHISQENLSKAKNLLKEVDDGAVLAKAMQEADAFFEDYDTMSNEDGLSATHKKNTAPISGNDSKKETLSKLKQDQKVTADISGRTQSGCAEVENLAVEAAVSHKKVLSNGGFQTASGKGVAISHVALQKAKTLFSECEGVDDQIGIKPTHSKMSAPAPPPRKGGFFAASGKPVGFSSEALQRAKALFSDIGFSTETRADSETSISEHKDHPIDTPKIHGGFTTPGTRNIRVSQKNLLNAKNPMKDISGGDGHDLNRSSTSRRDTQKSHISKVERTVNSKDMPAKDSVPQTVQSFISQPVVGCENEAHQISIGRGCISHTDAFPSGVADLHDSSREEMSSLLDKEINPTSSREGSQVKSTEESQVVCFQSLNLSDCTETQQMFLAQEALDCTKALLQDESLTGQELSGTLEGNMRSSNNCGEEQRGTRKRLVEDPEITSQPPLKRRLLEDFDRTVDGPRGSTLHPEKSCPTGVMKDRRVFRYSVALHPNVTVPHRDGKSFVEARLQKTTPTKPTTPRDSRSGHSKMPTFVPPFHKNANAEGHQHTALRDDVRTPSAFVPPFKKQRTVVQESSSRPQEGGAHRQIFVPPTKKTQNTDVTDYKEDTETLAATTSNLMKPQNIPAGCGSEAAEASCVDDMSKNQDMFQNLESVELARDMQAMRIRKKKRQTIRPLPGSLFLTKTSGAVRIPLKAAVEGKPPARCTAKQLYSYGIHQNLYKITSETAESYRFSLLQFMNQDTFVDAGGVQLADGGWLIPSHDGTAGKEEFYRALCDTPGVDPKLISEEWVYNHYRWIVWKQASMERSFPETMGGLCLSPEQVLLQLKYRYDVEVDRSRRPALRKIMEKDDTSAKTLVLCVCGVVSRGHSPKKPGLGENKTPGSDPRAENPFAVVWLTDGWYAIKAQLDEPMTAMLHSGRLAVGGKLITHGAQLVGSQDACSPLEAPESLMLKICANSSRPARWDVKLGFYRDPRPFLLPVSCLYSNGGPVGCVDIILLRSYPVQWMERKPDGVVFRSVRAEEKEAQRYNSHKQKAVEILLAKIQSEFEKEEKGKNKPQRRRRTISRQDVASLTDGEELYEAVGDDPTYLEAHLSEQQLEALRGYRRSLMEKKQAELQDRYRRALENAENHEGSCPKRDVTPVWRLSVADSVDRPGRVYQLSLWRPTSDLQSLLREGCRYKVYNLSTSDGRKHGGSTAVQLTGTKKTQFEALEASPEWLATHFQPRLSTCFVDLQNPDFQPLCGEVDLAGYVISIVDGQGFSPAFYLADGELNFIKVRCFSSFAQSGLGDVVKPQALLGLSNLQLRGQSTCPMPVVYAGDLTVFSTNPKEAHLQESLSQLRKLVQTQESFFLTAEEKLSHLVKCDSLSSISTPALQTRTPASTTHQRQETNQSFRSLGSFTPISKNPPSMEKDPSSLKRRRALDYLSRIPSPPPLAQLSSAASPCVKKTFNPPRRSATPGSVKTQQTPARKPVHLPPVQDEWVNDEELAMIDTQALHLI